MPKRFAASVADKSGSNGTRDKRVSPVRVDCVGLVRKHFANFLMGQGCCDDWRRLESSPSAFYGVCEQGTEHTCGGWCYYVPCSVLRLRQRGGKPRRSRASMSPATQGKGLGKPCGQRAAGSHAGVVKAGLHGIFVRAKCWTWHLPALHRRMAKTTMQKLCATPDEGVLKSGAAIPIIK